MKKLKPKILYLSKNMDTYHAAMYQKNVMIEFTRQADVNFYGPGFPDYDLKDSIQDIVNKKCETPDFILMGHAWLSDISGMPVDPHPNLGLEGTRISKIAIINKEYVNLKEKLEYIKAKGFDLVFTHHHDTDTYSRITGVPFVFWPFAFDHQLFGNIFEKDRSIDFAFSGVLQNLNKHANQTDLRVRIQKKIFTCLGDVPVLKKQRFRAYSIFWNTIPRKKTEQYIARIFRKHRFLSEEEYSRLQHETQIYLNTLSPMGLVSPRYYENMASKTLVFCEESEIYHQLFPPDCYVSFKPDLSDFEDKLVFYLENKNARQVVVQEAYKMVMADHTWQKRVRYLLGKICGG